MIETFLFGMIMHVETDNYSDAIKSIIGNEDFFIKNVKLVLVDTQEKEEVSKFLQSLEDKYLGNIIYVKSDAVNRADAYNDGLPHCKAKYIHFTHSDVVHREGTLEAVKAYADNEKENMFAIHTKYVTDITNIPMVDNREASEWDFTEQLSYLPLYLNRYFIRYSLIKDRAFNKDLYEDAEKFFLIPCFEEQKNMVIIANTLMFYSEPQERNLTSYQVKNEKWWYIPQIRDVIIPMLQEYRAKGEIPEQVQKLLFYMIRVKYYHNMNSRYDYALNYDEVREFFRYTKEALQYIDDHSIRSIKNTMVTPKYMTYYFLQLKYGKRDGCPEVRKNKDGKLAFFIQEDEFVTMDQMVVSLQGFSTDKETGERLIEADWFYHYLLQNSQCEIQIEANGKPAIIKLKEKNVHETCFGKMVRRKYKFVIHIPKEERRLLNQLKFYAIIRGEKYMIEAKYARRKLVSRVRTRIKQGRFSRIFQRIARAKYVFYYGLGKCFTKQKANQVAMLSDSRASLSGNLEFVDKELKNQGFDVKYFFKSSLKEQKTLREVIKLCMLMASSKYIVLDDFYPIVYPLKIRKNAKLIQVWHAMGAFKTVGFSRVGKPGGPNPRSLTHRNYTAAITSAEGIRHNYAEAFGIDVEKVHATGVPRTDIFFDEDYIEKTKNRLYENYPSLKKKKVVLFAPTFRGAGQKSAHYNFDWINFQAIEEALGDEYVFIVKLHPFIQNLESVPEDNHIFLDMSSEREINDLLFVTDVLITDYSSVIFEASLLNINTIFYVPDLVEYTESRDFYYPFEKYTYGEIAENMDELLHAILHPANDVEKLEAFKQHFCGACDGQATKRFVDTLFTKE